MLEYVFGTVIFMTLVLFATDIVLILFDYVLGTCSTAFDHINPDILNFKIRL